MTYTKEQVRDIVRIYYDLTRLKERLEETTQTEDRAKIAKNILNFTLPQFGFYIPEEIKEGFRYTNFFVNVDSLEQKCRELTGESS